MTASCHRPTNSKNLHRRNFDMIGIGTIANTGAVIAGGIIGILFKKGLSQRFQDTIMQAIGLAVIFIGISGTLEKMLAIDGGSLTSGGTMMCAVSLALGAVIGEWMNIEKRFVKFGDWLRKKSGREKDSKFIDGFVMTTLTICVGAMAVIGPLQDGLAGDPSMLYTKALLGGIIVAIFSAAFGVGAIFSAIPLFLFQGSITLLARAIQIFLTTPMIDNMSMIGSMLIFCVGVNMIFPVKIKVANMLPSLIVVILYTAWLG